MPLLIKNRKKFPANVRRFRRLKGISIGGCVDKRSMRGHSAHAHCINGDKFQGWICFHYKWQLETESLQHEIAHLLDSTSQSSPHHGKRWFDKFVGLCGGVISVGYRDDLERWFPWLKKYMDKQNVRR